MCELCLGPCSVASTLQPWCAVAKSTGFRKQFAIYTLNLENGNGAWCTQCLFSATQIQRKEKATLHRVPIKQVEKIIYEKDTE